METQNNGPPSYVERVLEYSKTKWAFNIIAFLASSLAIVVLCLMASKVSAQSTFSPPPHVPTQVLVGYHDNRRGGYPLRL